MLKAFLGEAAQKNIDFRLSRIFDLSTKNDGGLSVHFVFGVAVIP